jgi:hypothetical protein
MGRQIPSMVSEVTAGAASRLFMSPKNRKDKQKIDNKNNKKAVSFLLSLKTIDLPSS